MPGPTNMAGIGGRRRPRLRLRGRAPAHTRKRLQGVQASSRPTGSAVDPASRHQALPRDGTASSRSRRQGGRRAARTRQHRHHPERLRAPRRAARPRRRRKGGRADLHPECPYRGRTGGNGRRCTATGGQMTPPGEALATRIGTNLTSQCTLDRDWAPLSGVGSISGPCQSPGPRPVASPVRAAGGTGNTSPLPGLILRARRDSNPQPSDP